MSVLTIYDEQCTNKVVTKEIIFPKSVTNMANHEGREGVKELYDDIGDPDDSRKYRGLVLTNEMKVLLISNPKLGLNFAAMDVNIGYMYDPEDIPGLAHFCEHMIYLGSEQYQEQSDFDAYLSNYNGESNGETHLNHTTYRFKVSPEGLEGALDRFAQLFKQPLFAEELTTREINIINSEYEKNIMDDYRRFEQLEKLSVRRDHPYSNFGDGNKATLYTTPMRKKINVRERLLEFYRKYYSANIMSLCIYGPGSLDELEEMVVKEFCDLQNNNFQVSVLPEHPLNDEHIGTRWYFEPITDIRKLYISFLIPEMNEVYVFSPAHYISYVLEHRGEGSISSVLRDMGWGIFVTTERRYIAKNLNFFRVIVDLTVEGIGHIRNIILLMFKYLKMLNLYGPQKRIYDEHNKIDYWSNKGRNIDIVSTAQALQEYSIEEVAKSKHLFPNWKNDYTKEIMECLRPQNMRIYVAAKEFESHKMDKTEKWYNIKYRTKKESKNAINAWNSPHININMQFPPKNNFIATRFDIKQIEVQEFPTILMDTPFVRLWYKELDNKFNVPEATMIFNFVSPFAYMDPLSSNLTHMFVELLRDSLYEYTHAANLANLNSSITDTKYGIELKIDGFDDKQRVLLEKIINQMINFEIDLTMFKILKEKYIRHLKSFTAEQPSNHSKYYYEILLLEQVWLNDELLESTACLSVNRLKQFILNLFSKVHVECLIYGNVTKEEAINAVELIESKLKTVGKLYIEPLSQRQLVLYREIKLEDGCHILYKEESKGLHEGSYCTMVYYPIGLQSKESNTLFSLLSKVIEEPLFDTLRTQFALGYIVQGGAIQLDQWCGTQCLVIVVQGDKEPQAVEECIDYALGTVHNKINNMSEEQFVELIDNAALSFVGEAGTINDQCNLYWKEIAMQRYNFDQIYDQIYYSWTITRQKLLTFFEENIYGETRRKLSVHIISTATSTEKNLPDKPGKITVRLADNKVKEFDDIVTFKSNQNLHPLVQPSEKDFLRKGKRF